MVCVQLCKIVGQAIFAEAVLLANLRIDLVKGGDILVVHALREHLRVAVEGLVNTHDEGSRLAEQLVETAVLRTLDESQLHVKEDWVEAADVSGTRQDDGGALLARLPVQCAVVHGIRGREAIFRVALEDGLLAAMDVVLQPRIGGTEHACLAEGVEKAVLPFVELLLANLISERFWIISDVRSMPPAANQIFARLALAQNFRKGRMLAFDRIDDLLHNP